MSRKLFALLLCCCLLPVLSACSGESGDRAEPTAAPVDLDLSLMSGTVVYAEVYNMMADPSQYLHKVIRIRGVYSVFEEPSTGMVYHACVIPDATACCMQGIEFVWGGEHQYPDDYAEAGVNVTVTGRLEMYEEGGISYLHLVDSDVVWDEEGEDAA